MRRWPWLVSDDLPPELGPRPGGESIQIARTVYYGGEGRWIDWSDLAVYTPSLVLWGLEAVLAMSVVRDTGTSQVRDADCVAYVGEISVGDIAGGPEARLVAEPAPDHEWRKLYADVCVDAKGLIRRIAWTPKFHKQRSGGLVRHLARLTSRSPNPSVQAAGSRTWGLLELWDYGCDVHISAPPDPITNCGPSWSEIARDLWRLKREYKPTSPAPSDD